MIARGENVDFDDVIVQFVLVRNLDHLRGDQLARFAMLCLGGNVASPPRPPFFSERGPHLVNFAECAVAQFADEFPF